jgi:hypothetical protein
VTLQALNFSGAVIGTATITINNTTPVQPASAANLVISEIMYHPTDPDAGEITSGFTDDGAFEFIELQNISAAVVDMTGVRFTGGIEYDFSPGVTINPGARLVVAANRTAFLMRYPGAAAALAASEFKNGTQLSNAGETLTLTDALGAALRSFAYDDALPWPLAADGNGYSLVLVAPASNPDHGLAASWRLSSLPGGNPGTSDFVPFTGDPDADVDHDGFTAWLEHALGTSDNVPGPSGVTVTMEPDNYLTVSFTHRISADDAICEVQSSPDLVTWTSAFTIIADSPIGDGTAFVTARSNAPVTGRNFTRLRVSGR